MRDTNERRWKMKKYLIIFTCLLFSSFLITGVSAADAHIFTDVSDNVLLTIGTDGSGNFTGDVMEDGIKLSDTYCALTGGCALEGPVVITGALNITGDLNVSGTLYGDGSGLEGVIASISDNSTQIAYQNITNLPTCALNEFFSFDGSDITCVAMDNDGITLDAANITAGTLDAARLPDLENLSIIAYQNISNIPTCGAGDVLTFDGSTLSCTTPSSSMDYTNLALTNETNVFVPEQNFTGGINSADDIALASAKSLSWDDGGSVTATAGVITYKAGV